MMTMTNASDIKRIICINFDESPIQYEDFESKYGFFRGLAMRLAKASDIREGMTVMDVGCGTGISTQCLSEIAGKEGKVIGCDFSEQMLKAARLKDISGVIEYISADAIEIDKAISVPVDAIMYNASIFLIPETSKVIGAAHRILRNKGTIAMNYPLGLFGNEIDVFKEVKEEGHEFAPYGRQPVDSSIIPEVLKATGFSNVRVGTDAIIMESAMARDFYRIPAQSAGLYPKLPYSERLPLVDRLFNHLESCGHNEFLHLWGWCRATKKSEK